MNPSLRDENLVLRVVRNSDAPLTPKKVAQAALGSSGSAAVEETEEALARLSQAGCLHEYPPEQKGRARRFGAIPPVEWVRRRILDKVRDSDRKVTQKQVKDHLRKWEMKYYDDAVGGLIREGKLYELRVRYKYLVSFRPTPSDYLLARQVTALKEILERINRRRSRPLSFEELRALLDGSTAAAPAKPPEAAEVTEEMLRTWYDEDVRRLGGSPFVPIPATWKRYDAWSRKQGLDGNLTRFHELLSKLAQGGRIDLIPHSRTHEIPSGEADLALTGSAGELLYYWKWR